MKLLPYDKFSIQSDLSPASIVERLGPHVEPVRIVRWRFAHVDFEGRAGPAGFRLRWILHFVRPFLPVVYGRFEPRGSATLVRVEIAPHPLLLTVLIYWLLSFTALVFTEETHLVALMLGLVFFASWMFALFGFWLEDGRSRKRLTTLLAGTEDPARQ